ncbi:MAG: hypothetical protein P4M08_01965 [Oligoflexia bacterium]|nr:hypothetical protein [Oligoflexia bacterium]
MALSWGLGLIALVGSLYFLLIYPIAAIYSCAKNKPLPSILRAIWIIAIVITGPLASAAYFLRHPKSRASRVIAVASLVFLGVSLVSSIDSINQWVDRSDRELADSLNSETLRSEFRQDVTDEQRQQLIQNLGALRAELSSLPWSAVSRRLSFFAVDQCLFAMRAQGKLGADDVRFWESLYADRDTVGFLELEIRIQTRALTGSTI